jgi:hypothetical protein
MFTCFIIWVWKGRGVLGVQQNACGNIGKTNVTVTLYVCIVLYVYMNVFNMYVCMYVYVCVYIYIYMSTYSLRFSCDIKILHSSLKPPVHVTATTEGQSTSTHAIAWIANRSVMSTGAGPLLEARCHYRLFADSGVINGSAVRLPSCPYVPMYCSFYAGPIVRCTSPRWRCWLNWFVWFSMHCLGSVGMRHWLMRISNTLSWLMFDCHGGWTPHDDW